MLMAVTWPCFYDGKMLGVAGLDIQLGELLEGITYFPGDGSIYAFLIDGNGQYMSEFRVWARMQLRNFFALIFLLLHISG